MCTGIDWQHIREQDAPSVAPPPVQPKQSAYDFDWEWSSLAAALPVYYSHGACPLGAQSGPTVTAVAAPAAPLGGAKSAEPSGKPQSTRGPSKRSLEEREPGSLLRQTGVPAKERLLAVKVPSIGHHDGHSSPLQVSHPGSPSRAQPYVKSPAPGSSGLQHSASSQPTSPYSSKAACHAPRRGDWSLSGGAYAHASTNGIQNADLEEFDASAAMLMYQSIASNLGTSPSHHQLGNFSHSGADSDT